MKELIKRLEERFDKGEFLRKVARDMKNPSDVSTWILIPVPRREQEYGVKKQWAMSARIGGKWYHGLIQKYGTGPSSGDMKGLAHWSIHGPGTFEKAGDEKDEYRAAMAAEKIMNKFRDKDRIVVYPAIDVY